MENLIKEVKETRVELDGLKQLTDGLIDTSTLYEQEYLLTVTAYSIENSKNWLGRLLQYTSDSVSPYAKEDGNRHSVADIAPTADTAKEVSFPKLLIPGEDPEVNSESILKGKKPFREMNYIEKIDWLREELEKNIKVLEKLDELVRLPNRDAAASRTNAWTALCDAKMTLGNVLKEIRNAELPKSN